MYIKYTVPPIHKVAHHNHAASLLHLPKNDDDFLTMDSLCVPFLRRRVFHICMNLQSIWTIQAS